MPQGPDPFGIRGTDATGTAAGAKKGKSKRSRRKKSDCPSEARERPKLNSDGPWPGVEHVWLVVRGPGRVLALRCEDSPVELPDAGYGPAGVLSAALEKWPGRTAGAGEPISWDSHDLADNVTPPELQDENYQPFRAIFAGTRTALVDQADSGESRSAFGFVPFDATNRVYAIAFHAIKRMRARLLSLALAARVALKCRTDLGQGATDMSGSTLSAEDIGDSFFQFVGVI